MTLFELDAPSPSPAPARVVRVLLDQPAIKKQLDYAVPGTWLLDGRSERLEVGSMVRVPVAGRRVAAWITALDVEPPAGVKLREITKLSGLGPSAELLELATWAAWRWGGSPATVLRTANPPAMVQALGRQAPKAPVDPPSERWARVAVRGQGSMVDLPPLVDPLPLLLAAASLGNVLVLTPSIRQARVLGGRMRRAGVRVGLSGRDWALGRSGASMVGGRAAAFAPVANLAAVVLLDEHDHIYQEERTPTWHARDVAVERARRAGVPVVLASPMLTPDAQVLGLPLVQALLPADLPSGWPKVTVVDRRNEPPGKGLWSDGFVEVLRNSKRLGAVLNRKGRSRLLACGKCGELAVCEVCAGAMRQDDDGVLVCRSGDSQRPVVCIACGATRFKNLRVGVKRAAEELEALARQPVMDVTAETEPSALVGKQLMVGTEALLHKVDRLDAVAFLDIDQSLAAGRYRAAEEALALLVRAARLVGPKGELLVQTSQPLHLAVQAAVQGNAEAFTAAEARRRKDLTLPPYGAVAVISGAGAPEFVRRLGQPDQLRVLGPRDDAWRVTAPTPELLADALAGVDRPPGRIRITVDPLKM